jgi:hypothetical protein
MDKNRPNGHKICQHLPLQDPPKLIQSGIFGLEIIIIHLATLVTSAIFGTSSKGLLKT